MPWRGDEKRVNGSKRDDLHRCCSWAAGSALARFMEVGRQYEAVFERLVYTKWVLTAER